MTDTKDKKREKLGILCCTAGATSWGLSGTCSEALFSQYPVDTTWVTAVRMTSAGIILLFLAFAKHSLNLKELGKDKKGLIEIVLFAIAGLALCQYAYLSAIKWTNSGTATVIQNLSIVFIAVYVCMTTRTAPDKRTVFCIFLALFGVWLLATGGKPGNMELTPRGLFWGLMAGIGAASYSLLSRAPVNTLNPHPDTISPRSFSSKPKRVSGLSLPYLAMASSYGRRSKGIATSTSRTSLKSVWRNLS